MKNISKLLRYALPYRTYLLLAIGAMFIQVFVGFYIPFIMIGIIDVALPALDFSLVLRDSAFMIGLAFLGMGAGILNTYTSQYIAQHASARLRQDLFDKIQTLSFKNIDDFKQSRLITNATNDVQRVQMFFTMMLRIVIRAPLMIVVGLILSLRTSLLLSQVFYITIPLLIISIAVIMVLAYPRFKKVQLAVDDLNNVVLENANAPQVVKSFVSQPHEREKFEEVNEQFRDVNTSAESLLALAEPIIFLIFNLGVGLILFLGAYYLNQDFISGNIANSPLFSDSGLPRVGLLMAFNQYSQQILFGLMMFAMIMIFLSRADVSATRINEIFDAKIDLTNKPNAIKPPLSGRLTFENVTFKYGENGGAAALKGVSFRLEPQESLGIIGSTGSGKSTLTSLIPRLYDTTEGSVYLDDYNVKDLDLSHLRAHIGFVTQTASIFSGSLATNILQGHPQATYEALVNAAKDADLSAFINEQDSQYNYLTIAKGGNLSGGQKQRLSIARAFIRQPKILILDDATSAVDLATEKRILDAINSQPSKPTLIVISQKVTTVKRMDKILVLNNEGEVDGVGTHEELLKTSHVYQEIAASQLDIGGQSHV